MESLPFIRVPFEKSEINFGKFGSFFCLSMLLLAVFCFGNSVGAGEDISGSQIMNYGKGRIMQEVEICGKN